MIQKLLLFSVSLFTTLIQNKFSSTAKWFCLSFLMFQMGYGQTCNVVKGGDFPNAASVTTNWGVLTAVTTGWYYEATYAPGEIYLDADGIGTGLTTASGVLRQNLTGLIGNKLTVSFKIKGQNADRMNCNTSATLDVRVGGVTYFRVTNPGNNSTITESDITPLNGATRIPPATPFSIVVGGPGTGTGGAKPGIAASALTQGTITFEIPWSPATAAATIADLEFVALTSSSAVGTGTCNATWGGDDWILDDIALYASNPTAYPITGLNTCNSPTTIGLANSQLGVNYQLYRNGSTAVGGSVAGTGSAISFGTQNTVGVYTVVATAGTTTCTTTMTNSVSINALPTAPTASAQSFCAGATVASLVSTAPSGSVVDWYTATSGGTALATTTVLSSGSYYGQSRNTTTGCVSSTRTSIAVTINALPVAPTTSAQNFCAGATVGSLVATAPTSGSVVDWYSASNGGTALATTTVLSSATYYAQSRNTTTGCVSATRTSAIITINSNPTISTAAATGVVTGVCQSTSAQTTTMDYTGTTLSPTSYSIDWATLADQGSTAFSFAAGGGTLTGIIIPAGTTSGTYTGTMTVTNANGCIATKAITLTVNPVLTAAVSISASSGTVCAGANVTFTATGTNPGTAPVYQWKLNGVNVGTNSTTYTNSALLLNNDVVTCEMTSNATPCLTGSPVTSNAITVASSGPATTGVIICAGGSGSLSSSTTCANGSAVSTGTQEARTGGQISRSSGVTWSDPVNIEATGTPFTTLFITNTNTNTNYLTGTNYNFNTIPNNATIIGITASIRRRADGDNIRDNSIRLIKSGVIVGDDKSAGAQWSTNNSFNIVSFGGSSDLWGTTWTVAQVKDAGFGFAVSARSTTNGDRNLGVDYIQISVTYTVPGSINWYTADSDGTLLGSGSSFDPVGVTGSGLANTNTPGTYTFYAACSTNSTCRTPVTFIIRETPTATISGATTVCEGAASPNITFTNPRGLPITVNYTVNGTNASINVPANNTATVAAPTGSSGTFTYNLVSAVYQTAPTCSASLSGSAVVTVTPTVGTPTPVTVSSGSEPTCQLTNGTTTTTYATTATNNTGFNWSLSNASAGTINATTGVMTWANGFSGSVDIRVTANGCNGPSSQVVRTVTINSTPTTPTVGTITNISCTTNTGSVVLNDLPSSGNWSITSTPVTVTTTGSGNTTTISGLASGSYTFTVTNASGCPSPASALVTISDFSSTTWNGSGWSHGLPDATKNLIIASSSGAPFASDLAGCALTVNNGITASVPSGVTLTITNAVTVSGSGSLTFENTASLVQINNISNSGAIVYKRNSAPMKNFDFTYWASPVAGQTLYNLSPNTLWDKYFSFSGTAWVQITNGAGTMQPGIGYIIRVPKPNSTYTNGKDYWTTSNYVQPVEFIGVPNNGNITSSQTMVAGNLYLIGNPYPCAMDADEFLYTNLHNRAILEGTIYFWTHNTAITPTGTQYKYTSDDYASYNLTGGTGTSAGSAGNKTIPDGYIAAGQSFFATAKGAGNVEFNNSMRVGAYNNTFFKPGKTSKSTKLEKHRLWLNMINAGGAYKQALIGYVEGATNSFDLSFDGLSFDGNSFIDFYSVNAADNYVIQGRALPFTDTDVVPLGYRSTVAGDFTIAIDHADGNLATQRVYLEDKQTGMLNELTAGNYTFNTKAGTFNDRFVLKYTNRTLGTGDFESVDNSVSVLVQNKTITINSAKDNLEKVVIYDLAGKQLYSKDNINNLQLIMQNLPFAQQVLLVKIVLDNGTVTTKKIVFK